MTRKMDTYAGLPEQPPFFSIHSSSHRLLDSFILTEASSDLKVGSV
ncbi:hypothetical protein [Paenibacillus odorifer]|nr:hypothetical protein [Paenibacillus odorifer]